MIENYSAGNEALVDKEGENHIVRVQRNLKESHALKRFNELKIASLIYPEHFIKILSLFLEKGDDNPNETVRDLYVNSKIKSEFAAIDPDHSIFSKHLKRDYKFSNCICDVCLAHRAFHFSKDYIQLLHKTKTKLENTGIIVPDDDETDHCLGPGRIIFFEIVCLDYQLLWNHLQTLDESESTRTAKALIDYQHMVDNGLTSLESMTIIRKKYKELHLVDYSLNSSNVADSF